MSESSWPLPEPTSRPEPPSRPAPPASPPPAEAAPQASAPGFEDDEDDDGDVTQVLPPQLKPPPTLASPAQPAPQQAPAPQATPRYAPAPTGPEGSPAPLAPPTGLTGPAPATQGAPAQPAPYPGPQAAPPPQPMPEGTPWPQGYPPAQPTPWPQSTPWPASQPPAAPGAWPSQRPAAAADRGPRIRALPVFDQIVVGVAGVLVLVAVVLTAIAPVYPPRGRAQKLLDARIHPPAAVTSTQPTPSGSPAAGPDELPAELRGTWTGNVTQKDPAHEFNTTYPVTLVLRGGSIGQVVGTSNYPTIPCSGDLLLNQGGNAVQVTEHIVGGTNCSDTALSLTLDGNGNLVYHFDDVGDGTGDGVLTKQR
ncbi:hypothetical protein [Pseudofrankia inefficax]|uniref:Uncharacterized protein n=1 Tax=Pseudofrankia inefficax (strain DSM 45817 / CECT 9037 / DDB 130130 / EuI1c) TaxID=298654 RepID=E3JDC5_PSEI1|nr:hypothetical protein [Pseudofrankia inefficax]ADP83558.1 hypothetical protein FraEuI1c_5572 [Pseudofrankia inefficax]